MQNHYKLELKATLELSYDFELYRIVDFLNKNLKDKKVIFGLSKKDERAVISIYETWIIEEIEIEGIEIIWIQRNRI